VSVVPCAPDQVGFFHAAQAIAIKSTCIRKRDGRTTCDTHYYLTSLTPAEADPPKLARLIRSHWMIENGNHYRRDATWDEDGCRARKGHTTANLALLRGALLGGLLRDGSINLRALLQAHAARPNVALRLLLSRDFTA
jgi:predicted transposase YbfD/YdcC